VRRLSSVHAALLAAGVLAAAGSMAPVAAAAEPDPVPRVVFIVGPSGAATERYRAESRAAATVARKYTPDVTELYSPDATWPAVREALQGASLVIYMGHGNGWPSRYRDALYPPTQNGFGLNPEPTGDDATHQYFGEERIAADIQLADHAVVLLHHLCYASGLSEPGLAEGTLDQARQRVDNYAAGFIAAGAEAVIAEAYTSPSRYVASILSGHRSIDAIWRTSPTANGHTLAFESARSPGYVAQMDPEEADAGFERSIVLREGLVSADVLAGASGSPVGVFVADPLLPSLVQTGIQLHEPTFVAAPRAGTKVRLKIPFAIDDRGRLPAGLGVSARWESIDGTPTDPPATFALVTAEAPGAIVEPTALKIGKSTLGVDLRMPEAPGRYRLTITLHDDTGLAFDAASQAILPALIVRVTGEVDGEILAPASVTVVANAPMSLAVRVANLGTSPWGLDPTTIPRGRPVINGSSGTLVGHWVRLAPTGAASSLDDVRAELTDGLAAGAIADAALAMTAPDAPGDYLLILDVAIPEHGSLTALGVTPTIVRVHVEGPFPDPAPDEDPGTADPA
jgi:hypothetical protein